MKKLFKYLILALVPVFSACEDFLEEVPVDAISNEYIYSSPAGIEVGVNGLYNRMRSNNFPQQEGAPLQANAFFYCSDDLGLVRTWFRPYGPTHNPSGWTAYKWVTSYDIIDKASAIIVGARSVPFDDAVRKNKLVAQARAIRGEVYFDLLQMYGRILLDTIPTTPLNAFDPVKYEPADPNAVLDLIEDDLNFAIAHLGWNEGYGRYAQGVARHIRGKVAMWRGDWAEAALQFDAIVNNGTHSLLTNINQVFGQNLNHAEALFVYRRDFALGGNDGLAGGGGTWIGSMFVNRVYEMQSGDMINDVEYGGQSLGWAYPNNYLRSLYDEVNDRRFTTYYYPLQLVVNNPNSPRFGRPLAVYDNDYRRYHWSLKKFHDTEKPVFTNDSFKDIMLYRFAETLLLGAEAHWRLDGENPSSPKALDYINRVRRRAYGNSNNDFTQFTLNTYLEESARELAFEKNRWFLLKRLGLLVERQNEHYRYGSNTNNEVREPMAPHMVNMPIPQSQIDLFGEGFPQNEGYF